MTEKMNVDEAITAVMRDVTHLGKNQKNSHQGFNFRGIDDVMNIVGPSMRKHGLKTYTRVLDKETGEKPTKNSVAKTVDLTVEVVWRGPDGSEIVSSVAAESFDSGDKATTKAMSVALRTSYLQTLCLPTNEPDPDSFSYNIVDDGAKKEFLDRLYKITDIDRVRKMEAQAIQAGAKDEWTAYGISLVNKSKEG
ncbi:hypothetical protein BJF89_13705 [Corynebacterium sp. CNJ-954]|uniref:ERF family protein n=1 Tax=Corynebacterium sp. CNJ-954 TaxID=1904962 RepID=UPI0009625438|nr:ERF family protein [Corynebacterium sp. CNJ-954]OLT55837.1 hypothetical protein BJF89_13705 [Corynebacterium sp. CNJ-954]